MALLGALDQGTTSTRFIVFDDQGIEVARDQLEHRQVLPRPGWVEHDPEELWRASQAVIEGALRTGGIRGADLAAIGVTNQRETVVVWDPRSGAPLCNAIVWQDTRTAEPIARLREEGAEELVRRRSGLPLATYFSAPKLRWALDHVDGLRRAAGRGEALFGTVDSYLVWKLTGGRRHVTDVTNASRTQLMDLTTLEWDEDLLALFEVPRTMLPEITSSTLADPPRTAADGPLSAAVPIGAVLGDQQAAMLGQLCIEPGDAKCTYGTGSFLLVSTGSEIVRSERGLLTTVCCQLAGEPARFALEGSVAVTGAAVQWLRDQLGLIKSAADSEALAGQVEDAGGVVFVPAFSGLFAPYWRPDARGTIVGLTRSHTAAHLARATLEAIGYQCADLVGLMAEESGHPLDELKVDGGVAGNDLCMQLQADIAGIPVVRPDVLETTALGAAYAAGLAVGVFESPEELRRRPRKVRRFEPTWDEQARSDGASRWHRAIERSLGWVPTGSEAEGSP